MSENLGSYDHLIWELPASGWRQWLLDSCAWIAALIAAVILRTEFQISQIDLWPAGAMILLVVVVHLIAGIVGWLYQGRYVPGSFEEVRALGWVMVVEAVLLGAVCIAVGNDVGLPRSTVLLAAPMALIVMLAVRFLRRLFRERQHRGNGKAARRALIFGAGSLGQIMVQRMLTDENSPYWPVGLLDDDGTKAHLSIRKVPVLGKLKDLVLVAKRMQAPVLIVAVANADANLMKRIVEAAAQYEIDIKVVPTLEKSLGGRKEVGPVRDLTIEDLIERPVINLDIASIAKYLAFKRVLVTGAGGSIGQELCVQIRKYRPASLIMLDHDETHLQDTEFALWGTGLLMQPEIVLADIRDRDRLMDVFRQWKPEVVFHAAALKHVPMLQRYPIEAWDTNVLGTLNVLECARAVGTEVFVNISTDKAADPTTILGHSKRLAECLTSWFGEQTGRRYCSVRFGNVFGSRGSMIPLFKKMIDRDLPITVTSKDATRYFMTIPEACQLVVQAGAIGSRGDVMILDMGSPVRIMDIVNRMIATSGKECEVQVTGIRGGEKINEVLFSHGEQDDVSSPRDRTVRALVPPVAPQNLDYQGWLAMVAPEMLTEPEASKEVTDLEAMNREARLLAAGITMNPQI